jgi:hypothetical protein
VVVDALSRESYAPGQRTGRPGLHQFRQKPRADRLERGNGGRWIVDDFHLAHAA